MADPILIHGKFDPRWKTYYLLGTCLLLGVTVVGIPLLILLLPIIIFILRLQYAAMSCTVTEKFLKYKRGILTRTEKNVPLEQITDLGVVEGPLMRWLGIKQLTVETAGQSSMGPLVTLTAIEQAEAFRDEVLAQRDLLRGGRDDKPDQPQGEALQREILSTLQRIEQLLDNKPQA